MAERIAAYAEDEMRLLRLLRVQEHRRALGRQLDGDRGSGLPRPEASEEVLELLEDAVVDLASDADHDSLRLVPGVEVRGECVLRRRFDGLLRAEDVPSERLVVVQEPVVDASDVALRVVEIDVHLLEDHTLLLRDLGLVEPRVQEHVGEHVEGHVACLRTAFHVVAGDLLARERVELAPDGVDLRGDRARGGTVPCP